MRNMVCCMPSAGRALSRTAIGTHITSNAMDLDTNSDLKLQLS